MLDRVGALERFVPGWCDVRSRPQRDPYHRFTVDGHLLRTLAGVDALLERPERRSARSRAFRRGDRPRGGRPRRVAPRHRQGRPRRARSGGRRDCRGPGHRDGPRTAPRRARVVHGRAALAPARYGDTPGSHRREPDRRRGRNDRHRRAACGPVPAGGRRCRGHRSRGVDPVAAGADPRARHEGAPRARARHDGCRARREPDGAHRRGACRARRRARSGRRRLHPADAARVLPVGRTDARGAALPHDRAVPHGQRGAHRRRAR